MLYVYLQSCRWRPRCSPAVSLEDLLSNGSISPVIDCNGRVRRTGETVFCALHDGRTGVAQSSVAVCACGSD